MVVDDTAEKDNVLLILNWITYFLMKNGLVF